MASSSSLSFLSSTFFTPTTTSPSTSSLKSSLSLRFLPSYTKTAKHQPPIIAQAATLPVLNFEGEKVGETTLDIHTAPPETARAVVHRGLITDLQNKRRGTASTLTRGEVSGGGRKPYPQKKTGRARRGSMRTPLMPGGGVIFGPKPKDWSVKINRKEKRLALSTAIASAASGSAIVVEEFGDKFEDKPKTKEFLAAMGRWGLDPKVKSMFFMMDLDENVVKSSRNIGTLKMLNPRSLNLFDVLDSEKLVFTQAAVDYLNYTYGYEDEELEDGEGAWEIVEEEEEEEKGSAPPESSES